ncbi:MAG: FmdB family transcriptional regulator [Candidatus Rokuibacteriota bacterium]|nr:MAG: FmdB family transcriptional regulator [Candidatus Rokubacteria bacterium]
MPTYEYQCDKCGRTFEVRQRISAPPLKTCETCGGAVRRLISSTTFILKGEGWYVTDYPSAARKKAAESEKTTAGGDGKKSEKADGKKGEKKDAAPAKATTGASAPAPTSPPSTTSSASSTSSGSSSD